MAKPANEQWVRDYFTAMDAGDVDATMAYFASDSVFTFANNEPIRGEDEIEERVRSTLGSLGGIRHDLKNLWEPEDGTVIIELDVTYIRKDGSEITLSGTSVTYIESNLWAEQRIYADLGPLYSGA